MAEPIVDLRSDTVTKPSAAMRKAMYDAEVGDDVYREDPTVNRLQERAAEIFGREAGLYVASGTMGNQVALKVLTRHGHEVICEERCHIYNFEMGMLSAFSGLVPRTKDFLAYYVVPGMGHCGGGIGCGNVDWLNPLVNWVEKDQQPGTLTGVSTNPLYPTRKRPICRWPEVEHYVGSGDINDMANFVCVAPKPPDRPRP